jgi:REP element-mobilizing transposase RayT
MILPYFAQSSPPAGGVLVRQLAFIIHAHGGRRDGAGRKPAGARPGVAHRPRAAHDPRRPVHITPRAGALPASLRNGRVFPVVREALRRSSRNGLAIVEYSVQSNHVHLVVEASTAPALRSGLHGLTIRLARAINRALGRRGQVFSDRYHSRALTSPREVRNALVYVLQNFRKHGATGPGLDPCSSARSFDGWTAGAPMIEPFARARTWLLRWGWRRLGLLDPRERPR